MIDYLLFQRMKIIYVVLLFLAFISCEKEKCFNCETYTTITSPVCGSSIDITEFIHCGDKEEVEGQVISKNYDCGLPVDQNAITICD